MVIRTTTWLSLALACSGALTSAHAQQPAEPIADLLVDADEDFLVDRLDQRARPRLGGDDLARKDREARRSTAAHEPAQSTEVHSLPGHQTHGKCLPNGHGCLVSHQRKLN